MSKTTQNFGPPTLCSPSAGLLIPCVDSVCLTTTLCCVWCLHLTVSVILSNSTFRQKYFYLLLRIRIEFQASSMFFYIFIIEDGTDMLCRNVDNNLSMSAVQKYRRQKTNARLANIYKSQHNTTNTATTTTTTTTTTPPHPPPPTTTTTTTTTTIF